MALTFSSSNGLYIRPSSCNHVLEDQGIEERTASFDGDLIERASSCKPALSSIKKNLDSLKSLEEKDIVEIEDGARLKQFETYKRLLLLNGYIKEPSDLRLDSNAFPVLCDLRSRRKVTSTIATSKVLKFSPNIDMLRLNPEKAKINYSLAKTDFNHWLDKRWALKYEPDSNNWIFKGWVPKYGTDSNHWIDNRWIQECDNFTDFSRFHIAVFKKDVKTIEEMLSHRSKIVINCLIQKRDANNLTAFHWAVILGDSNIVKVILNQIKPEDRLSALNMQDNRGWSVFKWAIANQNEDLIKIIFSSLQDEDKAFLVTGIDQYKRSHIHYAIETGNNKIVKLLLDQILSEKDKSNLAFYEDFLGQTIFHLGVSILDVETFEILFSQLLPNKCARSMALQKLDNLNQTPLHYAAIRSDVKLLEVIIRNIVSEDKQKLIHIQDVDGKTALHLAVIHGISEECVSFLLDEVDPKYLKSYVMMKDKMGKTALHYLFSKQGLCNRLLV
ncbi:MAG: hypothetical protein KR126chlam4_00990 [Candidatus Anoxychlamydiales bacterium]|nr:hypothetical protein [Candidatus Anoxychlamydiales bacterium]HEU64862.1 ankyrin repeat domain-containing protein [Chlamydiota bacterium]